MIAFRPLIILLVIIIVAIAVIARRLDADRAGRSETGDDTDRPDRDLNDDFFQNMGDSTPVPFLKVYTPQDRMLIRSILDSAGIPSYQGSHHVGDLLPGVRIQGHNDSLIYIYDSRRSEAEVLVIDYLKNRVESLTGEAVTDLSNLAGIMSELNMTPAAGYRVLPEFVESDGDTE